MLRPGDVREQAMTGIRAAYAALVLFAVQRQCVHCDLRAPEALLEALLDAAGGVSERARAVAVPQHFCQLGSRHECSIGVTLDFAERNGSFGKPPIGVEHGVMRILPALLNQAVRGAALI